MDMNRDRACVFDTLRPVCVQLTKEHSRNNLTALSKILLSVDRTHLQDLQEYVLFPLRIILKNESKYCEELYTDVYIVMEMVISQTRVSSWDMFQDLFNSSCMKLGSPDTPGKVSTVSEELKMAVIKTIKALVKNADYSVVQKLFSVWSLPSLGHAVSVLLNIADQERSRPLKVSAMECLLELSQEDKKYCSRVKTVLGDTFAAFLPGISITLCHIVTGDSKQGQAVIKTALHVLTRVIRLVLDDKLLEESQTKQEQTTKQENVDPRLQNLVVKRTAAWLENTASKMRVIVKTVTKVKVHSSWKVRLGLIEMASVLLHHCTKSLKDCVPDFLELLVGMLGDDYPVVALQSKRDLEAFSQSYVGKDCRPLVEILEENLHSLTTSLPRLIRTADEDQKLATVRLLSGYLTLLGGNVRNVLMSAAHLQRLAMSLVQVLELDSSDIKIVEERTTLIGHGSSAIDPASLSLITRPRKYFKHFHDNKIFLELRNACRLLGYHGNLHILTDYFLDLFHESSVYRLQCSLIINEILLGTLGVEGYQDSQTVCMNHEVDRKRKDLQDLESIVRLLIDEYLSPVNFDLITTVDHGKNHITTPESRLKAISLLSSSAGESVNTLNKNILQICLYLEGLGNFAKVLGENFQPLLMKTLYPVLEKLGDDTAFISSSAYLSLCDFCTACKYSTIDELMRRNADYLVNAISLRLRHFHNNQRSPLVLKVMLQYSSSDILPLIDDTIQEILSSLDDNYGDQAQLFMSVLSELTKAVNKWFPPDSSMQASQEEVTLDKVSAGEFRSFFVDYLRQKRLAAGDVSEDDITDVEADDEVKENIDKDFDETEGRKIPVHLSVVKQVMMRCKHLMSSHNPRLRLLVLETVGHACKALQNYQNELLPLIHEVWPAFCLRFVDDEKLVTRKALDVLSIMGDVSRDFIRNRTVKDVIPKLVSFLEKQAQISVHTGHSYIYTVNCKLQHAVLSQFGHICLKLDIRGNDLDRVSSACVIYLSARQPKQLQQVAIETCRNIMKIEPDAMWLKLNDMACHSISTPSDRLLRPFKVKCQVGQRNEFMDNVSKLLIELEEKEKKEVKIKEK